MKLSFNKPARRELQEAADFYESVHPELRDAFLKQIRAGTEFITQSPLALRTLSANIRRFQLKQFPYGLLYEVVGDEVIIVAVMHLRRRPEYWRDQPD